MFVYIKKMFISYALGFGRRIQVKVIVVKIRPN